MRKQEEVKRAKKMKIQSSWKIDEIVKRTPLRQVRGESEFYVQKTFAGEADGDEDFYKKSKEAAENGKSFDISLRDKKGSTYPFAVSSFELYSFADKKNYLFTVLDVDADDFINFLAKPVTTEKIALHSDKWSDGNFHAKHDYKHGNSKKMRVLIKIVLVLILLALIAWIQKYFR